MARPVRLAIDGLGARHGGAARVALATTEAAIRSTAVDSVVLVASPLEERRFDLPNTEKLSVVEVRNVPSGVGRMLWQACGFRLLCRRAGITHALLLGNGGMADSDVVKGVLVQQSLPFVPEGLQCLGPRDRLRMAALGVMIAWSTSGADVVVVQTETMRNLLLLRLGCDAAKIRVIPAGSPAMDRVGVEKPQQGFRVGGTVRMLYVGNDSTYKNVGVFAPGLEILSRRGYVAVLTATVASGVFPCGRAREIGYVEGDRLASEYRESDCLVMPSVSETVCLPVIESMSFGLPVVVADRPYAREVCGSAAVFFDPASPEELADAVIRATEDTPERAARIEDGRRRALRWVSSVAYDEVVRAVLEVR